MKPSALQLLCEQIDHARCSANWDSAKRAVADLAKKRPGSNASALEELCLAEIELYSVSLPRSRVDVLLSESLSKLNEADRVDAVASFSRSPPLAGSDPFQNASSKLKSVIAATAGKTGAGLLDSGELSDAALHTHATVLLSLIKLWQSKPEECNSLLQKLSTDCVPKSSASQSSAVIALMKHTIADETFRTLGSMGGEETYFGAAATALAEGDSVAALQTLETAIPLSGRLPIQLNSERRAAMCRQFILLRLQSLQPGAPCPTTAGSGLNGVSSRPSIPSVAAVSFPHFPVGSLGNPLSGVPAAPFAAGTHNDHSATPNGSANDLQRSQDTTAVVSAAVQPALEVYEKLVTHILPFPRGEGATADDLTRYGHVQEVYDWWVFVESHPSAEERESVERYYRLIESMTLLRYLAHTFASLLHTLGDVASDDERTEGFAAIQAYHAAFEKNLRTALIAEEKRRRDQAVATPAPASGNLITNGVGPASPSAGSAAPSVAPSEEPSREDEVMIAVVDGETLADAVGVLLAGASLCVRFAEGDLAVLQRAISYTTFCVNLLAAHGGAVSQYHGAAVFARIQQRVFQMHGVAHGELAEDVPNSDDRKRLQARALEALRESERWCEGFELPTPSPAAAAGEEENGAAYSGPWDLKFQLALQLAEVGEIDEAIIALEQSLSSNGGYVPSWNLLLLVLSARKDHERALQVFEAGWSECISTIVAANGSVGVEGDPAWDQVDVTTKENLFSFKQSQFAIETEKFGPQHALDYLPTLFALYRKLFKTSDESAPGEANLGGIGGVGGSGSVSSVVGAVAAASGGGSGRGTPGNASPLVAGERRGSRVSSTHNSLSGSSSMRRSVRRGSVRNGTGGVGAAAGAAQSPLAAAGNSPATAAAVAPTAASILSVTPPSSLAPLSPAVQRFSLRAHAMQVGLWLTTAAVYRAAGRLADARAAAVEAERLTEVCAALDGRARGRESRVCSSAKRAEAGGSRWRDDGGLQTWGAAPAPIRRLLADVMFETFLTNEADYRAEFSSAPTSRFAQYLPSSIPASSLRSRHVNGHVHHSHHYYQHRAFHQYLSGLGAPGGVGGLGGSRTAAGSTGLAGSVTAVGGGSGASLGGGGGVGGGAPGGGVGGGVGAGRRGSNLSSAVSVNRSMASARPSVVQPSSLSGSGANLSDGGVGGLQSPAAVGSLALRLLEAAATAGSPMQSAVNSRASSPGHRGGGGGGGGGGSVSAAAGDAAAMAAAAAAAGGSVAGTTLPPSSSQTSLASHDATFGDGGAGGVGGGGGASAISAAAAAAAALAGTAGAPQRFATLVLELQRVTVVDDQHVAARVKLGQMHMERALTSGLAAMAAQRQRLQLEQQQQEDGAAAAAAESSGNGAAAAVALSSATIGGGGHFGSTATLTASVPPPVLPVAETAAGVAGILGPPASSTDLAAAEFWFERACKRSVARGGSGGIAGGAVGIGACGGGGGGSRTAWEAWAGLGQALQATGMRTEAAVDCMLYAAELERVSPVRGFLAVGRRV
ncbi:hypothetical protein DFJ73DRAFT_950298 [Zopfochytrium polystomum]|nr:hypothetical protein DFJ73DRAFT_950298 [Zopfochytrium polystomum]